MTIPELRELCRASLLAAKAEGFELVEYPYYDTETKCCCLVGSFVKENNASGFREDIMAKKLGFLTAQIDALENGFLVDDENDIYKSAYKESLAHKEFFDLGVELAKEFKPQLDPK